MSSRRFSHSSQQGFTIIETLIVLAVAGLILLIVFQAIPALQRSGRNNQRRQDVQTILGAVSRYELNNSGNFPIDCNSADPCTSVESATTPNDYFLRFVADKLTYYTAADQVVARGLSAGQTPGPPSDINTVMVYNHQKCAATGGGSTSQGAGYRDVVALYRIETARSSTMQCQQL